MTINQAQPSVAVVTGASAGIGRGAAVEIARHGTGVVLTYRTRPHEAEETVDMIRGFGGRAVALPLDVGRTDTFVGFRRDLVGALEREDAFDDYYRVLLRGPYFLTQALVGLIRDGGSIVNTSSSSIRPGETEAGYSGYAAMKAGLVVATRYLARELGARGIRINSVAPGPTRTRISDDAFERFPEIIDGIAARTALGRIGEPADIGKVIAFLVSDDSAWITGQDIQVAGGYAL